MNNLSIFICNLPSICFVIGSIILAMYGINGWWWLAIFGLLTAVTAKSEKK